MLQAVVTQLKGTGYLWETWVRIKLGYECDVQGSSQICYCSAQNVVLG